GIRGANSVPDRGAIRLPDNGVDRPSAPEGLTEQRGALLFPAAVNLCGCVTGLSRVSLLPLDLYSTVPVCGVVFAGVTDMGGVWCHLGDDGRVSVLQIPERMEGTAIIRLWWGRDTPI
ncbi:hypothetical protein, partial [Streptomyces sp. NPDC047071]|uniref:hypothetical protein n=1 Tax=Streptomyces sp. NPDC047071 TaxID=3154808 RepID=UPI003455AFC6